jgi:hypothetical protein
MGRREKIEQVMADAPAQVGSRLSGPTVQASVDLHGVHRHDLGVETFGDLDRDDRLARRGWTDESRDPDQVVDATR